MLTKVRPFTLNLFAGNDPGVDTIASWTIDWGDGTVETIAGNPNSTVHTYADGPNQYTITALVTDEDGSYASNDHTVTVLNVEPERMIGGANTVDEGAPFTLNLFAGNDPGDDTISSWTIDWGDGTVETVQGNPETAVHVYVDGPATFVITADVTDEDGTYAANDHTVQILDVEPNRSIGGPHEIPEGSVFTLEMSATSSGGDVIESWTIDWGDGTVETILGNPDSATHVYPDGPETHVISASVTDQDGTYDAGDHTVTVLNVEPERMIDGTGTVNEGSPYTLDLFAGNDPGDDTIASWTINWGDGTVETINGNPDSAVHTYVDGPESFVITASVTDEDGTYVANDHTVTVLNVAPERTIDGDDTVDEGSPFTLNLFAGNDPGVDTIASWTIDWGDGTTETISGNPNLAVHTYADGPNQFTITASVTDEDGTYVANDHVVTVLNVAPERSIDGEDTVNEGSPFTLDLFAGNDPGQDTIASWTIDWGDGTVETVSGNPNSAVHTYADGPNQYTISAFVTDEDGDYQANDHVVTVLNVAPERSIDGEDTVDEGSPFTLNLFAGNDPGDDTIASWTIDWGDGTVETISGNPSSTVHTYADGPNQYTISAFVTDEDGDYQANDHVVTVLNVAPERSIDGDDTVNEGSPFTLNLFAGNDPGQDTISSWTIDWGDGTTETIPGNPSSAVHTYADGPNQYTISAFVTDEDGDYQANDHVVTVLNVAPERSIDGDDTVDEGSPFTLNLFAGNDPGVDTIASWTIDWGDGTVETISGNPNSAVHTYADGPNSFTISAFVTDEDGAYQANDHVVTVLNVEPERMIDGDDTVNEGSPFTLDLFAGNDPGVDTIASWTIDWGDGTVETIAGNPNSTVHTYADGPNQYTITALVTDEDGSYASNDHTVTVLNVEPERMIGGANTVDEGAPFTLNLFAGNDPGDDTISSWTIDWGDGTVETVQGNPETAVHVYVDGPATFVITADVTDEDGTYAANDHTVQILDVEPNRSIGGPHEIPEGSVFTLEMSATSSGGDVIESWTIDWGDGTVETILGNPDSATHVYPDGPETHVISASVTDQDGTYDAGDHTVTVLNVEPERMIDGTGTVNEGSPYTLDLFAGNDPGDDTIASWTINWGDGTVETINGNPDSAVHTYVDGPESFVITASVTDEDGTYVANDHTVTVLNVAPERTIDGDDTVDEGSPFTLNLFAGNDPGVDTIASWTIDWGDGTTETISGNPNLAVHTYADGPNQFTITASVTDEDGTYVANDHVVTVLNVAPERLIDGEDTVNEGSPFTLDLFAGNDPGQDTIASWTIDWGDGTVETVSGNPNSAVHTYADGPNQYTISAFVTDEDGDYQANDHVVTVLNVAPERSIDGEDTVDEGSPFTLNLFAGNDPGDDTIASWTIDWGDGTVETISGIPVARFTLTLTVPTSTPSARS